MRNPRGPVLTIAASAVLALAGCGGGDDAGPKLRTTPASAPGTVVTIGTARTVVPPGWVEETALAKQINDGAKGKVQARAFVLKSEQATPKVYAILLTAREPGAGKGAVESTDTLTKNFKAGFESTSGLKPTQTSLGPKTELGGQPAGTLLVDPAKTGGKAAGRALVTGRGDDTYALEAIGTATHQADVNVVAGKIQQAWSWR